MESEGCNDVLVRLIYVGTAYAASHYITIMLGFRLYIYIYIYIYIFICHDWFGFFCSPAGYIYLYCRAY